MALPSFYMSLSASNNDRSVDAKQTAAVYVDNRALPIISSGASSYEIGPARLRITGSTRNLPLWQATPMSAEEQAALAAAEPFSFTPSVNTLVQSVTLQYQWQGFLEKPQQIGRLLHGGAFAIRLLELGGTPLVTDAVISWPQTQVFDTNTLMAYINDALTAMGDVWATISVGIDSIAGRLKFSCPLPLIIEIDFDSPYAVGEGKVAGARIVGGIPGRIFRSTSTAPAELVLPNAPLLPPPGSDILEVDPWVKSPVFESKQYLQFIPVSNEYPPPPAILKESEPVTPYYWAYSYSHVMDLYNDALERAWYDIRSQFNTWVNSQSFTPPYNRPGVLTVAPSMEYDTASQHISVSSTAFSTPVNGAAAASAGLEWPAHTEEIRIGIDSRSQKMFSGLPWKQDPGNSDVWWLDFPSPRTGYDSSGRAMVIQSDEYISIAGWSPVAAICINSSSGITPELINPAYASAGTTSISSLGTSDMITDVLLGKDVIDGEILYTPSIIRYNTFSVSDVLQSLAVYCTWRHVDGRVFPLLLSPQDSFDVKFHIRLIGYPS